ncbi:hypothetical protein CTAYLR_005899 [Chrysophaeum taylorii]|uniref:Phospholipid/glycerol acyltransferase domain-containing protein n=1 Tax=Chrysophaeum taylorii TaxID=2483200 RepID=A0AAD7XMI6_9STRA|nr:hypothetical protein CTAYLR_005872 [Chrysophaeum taylorii]KAJ8614327.1 hypothetical protein CTAYLR_005899 [Chrysophaeum taylorii]
MFGWLLWAAVGSTSTLNAYGFPPLLSTICGSAFCLSWILLNVSSRQLVTNFLGGCTDVFFRQIVCVGAHKLNTSRAPMLLAIAPHSNQFLDPMIVMKTFERPIGFLCAAKSMRYKRGLADLVAFFARTVGAVPVERPQDLAKEGRGLIDKIVVSAEGKVIVHGANTKFSEQVGVGSQLVLTTGSWKGAMSGKCTEVASDTVLALASGFTTSEGVPVDDPEAPCAFKVVPKLNHDDMYDAVYSTLSSDGVIGIFPEGGSHDRASLLPLKAGIAVMALGACERHGEPLRSKLRVAAVGLNYFSGHRFRSRVFVDYGEPFEIPQKLIDEYKDPATKRHAADQLMQQILTAVKAVTVQAPDHNTQELLYMLRRLYVADDASLSIDQKVAITRGFASCFLDKGDYERPEVKALLARVSDYNEKLKQYKIHDRRVSLGDTLEPLDALAILGFRFAILAFYAVALVPGLLLASPLLLLAEVISRRKAKQAVASSRVKLVGNDVVATWKVLVGMIFIPILHFVYTAVVFNLFCYERAVAFFFFMPFVSATSIIASESFWNVARSIGPLWMLVFDRTAGAELRRQRRILQTDVRHLANTLGWNEIIHKSTSRPDLAHNIIID